LSNRVVWAAEIAQDYWETTRKGSSGV
jgi:hypothetical protein